MRCSGNCTTQQKEKAKNTDDNTKKTYADTEKMYSKWVHSISTAHLDGNITSKKRIEKDNGLCELV